MNYQTSDNLARSESTGDGTIFGIKAIDAELDAIHTIAEALLMIEPKRRRRVVETAFRYASEQGAAS